MTPATTMKVALTGPSSTPSAAQILIIPESSDSTIIFGTFGLCVAIIGIVVAILQLRHMQRRKQVLEIFELA